VQDNFFSLGGDSILSIRVVSMLKSRGINLSIKDIFQHQTIAQLAVQAMRYPDAMLSKLGEEAAEQKERLSAEGKTIEEGIFS
jgi:phosphopantetheine binding protein